MGSLLPSAHRRRAAGARCRHRAFEPTRSRGALPHNNRARGLRDVAATAADREPRETMAEVTDEQVRKAVEEEAEEDPEFLASLTEGLSSQRDVRERAARRLDVDEALLKPFKKTIKAVMTDSGRRPTPSPRLWKRRRRRSPRRSGARGRRRTSLSPRKTSLLNLRTRPSRALRGKLTIDKTGRLTWSGARAFGRPTGWKRGERSKFLVKTKKPLVGR